MPGPQGYGPAGKWVHDRAHKIMSKGDLQDKYGPEKGKSIAYAISTQQGHKIGKTPKDFRTAKGVRVAKRKYDEPKSEYQKTAQVAAFLDELEKISSGHADIGAEALGLPGAALTGGKGGLLGAGAGFLGGLGARDLVGKALGGQFSQNHPIAAKVMKAAPLALGTTIGATLGEHFLRHR